LRVRHEAEFVETITVFKAVDVEGSMFVPEFSAGGVQFKDAPLLDR